MADLLNWKPGHQGKGNVYDSGDVSTWDIDAAGDPHHQEKAHQDGEFQPVFLFYIEPDGAVHDGGIGFNNLTATPDDVMLTTICNKGQALYDASDEEVEFAAPPRNPGGYGHAKNLLDMLSKTASMGAMHSELKIPRHIRKKIRQWVDKLDWPEGTELMDARTYHITILTFDKFDDEFIKFMSKEIRGREFNFKSTQIDMFGDYAVLRLDCPEWEELAVRWGELADNRDLEPRRFPGGPKCHISVAEVPDGKWPQGVPNPNIEFSTRSFNVNINDRTASIPSSPLEELIQFVQGAGEPTPDVSPHHADETQVAPRPHIPVSTGPHVDPPSHPYEPYDWAAENDYKTSADINYEDDRPGSLHMPADWPHVQKRIQHFHDQALEKYQKGEFFSGTREPAELASEWLITHLEELGLSEQDLYDTAKRLHNEIMDMPIADPKRFADPGGLPDYVPEQPHDDARPTDWKEWREIEPNEDWLAGPDMDNTPAQIEPVEHNQLRIPDDDAIRQTPYERGGEKVYRGERPGPFTVPQGWERTNAETQALVYQLMNTNTQLLRSGRIGIADAMEYFERGLQPLNLPIDRYNEALEEFQGYCQQVMDAQPATGPNAAPPEWTAAMKRIAGIVLGEATEYPQQPMQAPQPTNHNLKWEPGQEGKGFVLQDGSVWTWPTQDLRPMHREKDYTIKKRGLPPKLPGSAFHLNPSGGVYMWGPGRTLRPEVADRIVAADPRLTPTQIEINQGNDYGHAQALLDILRRQGSFTEYPDARRWQVNIGNANANHLQDWMSQNSQLPFQAISGEGGWEGNKEQSAALHIYDASHEQVADLLSRYGQDHPSEEAFAVVPQGQQSFLHWNPHHPVQTGQQQMVVNDQGSERIPWEQRQNQLFAKLASLGSLRVATDPGGEDTLVPQESQQGYEKASLNSSTCQMCGLDHAPDVPCETPDSIAQHRRMEQDWYDAAWSEPGSPTEWPRQPVHYKDDSAQRPNQA